MLLHSFPDSLAAPDLGGGIQGALHIDNPDLLILHGGQRLKIRLEPCAGPVSLQTEIRTGPDCIQILILNLHFPVDDDHRDACVPGLLEGRIPAVFRHRIQDNIINVLADEFPDGLDLVLLLLLGIAENEIIAVVGSKNLLHGSAACKAPVRFRTDLGKTDRQLFPPVDRDGFFIHVKIRAGFLLPAGFLFLSAAGQGGRKFCCLFPSVLQRVRRAVRAAASFPASREQKHGRKEGRKNQPFPAAASGR